MDWSAIGTNAVSSGVNTLLGLFGYNNQLNDQKQLMAQQYQYQKDFYNYTYNLNSPANQVSRLKEAGLNPALAYGQVQNSGGSTSSSSNASAPQMKMGQVDFTQALATQSLIDEKNASVEVMNANKKLILETAEEKRLDNLMHLAKNGSDFIKKWAEGQLRLITTQGDKNAAEAYSSEQIGNLYKEQIVTEISKQFNLDKQSELLVEKIITEKQSQENLKKEFELLVAKVGSEKANKVMLYSMSKQLEADAELNKTIRDEKEVGRNFWFTNAYNQCSKILTEASKTGALMDSQIAELKAIAGQAVATSGSEIWDIILSIVGLFAGGKTNKIGFK